MSEQLSPKAIIAESIIENFEAVSSYVARQSLRDMLDENQTLRAENARLREAVVWALGYTDFRAREHGEGPYWWRVELRLRSKLTGEQIDATLAALQPERGAP